MKKAALCSLIILIGGMFCPAAAVAQRKITIKVASLVPESTPWGAALNRIAAEWRSITGGEVEFQIYHNGVAGSEADVLRKLRSNQIQAAVLTSFGLNSITPEILTLSCPFLIRNDAELAVVLEGLKPELEAKINDRGFFTLAWSRVGWIKIFSKTPVFLPGDLKRQKLGTSPDEPAMMQAFKTMGFQMVAVDQNDILIALNGGMIDAVYQSPIAAGGFQLFGVAKHMSSLNIAPFVGGIVLNNRVWRSIPDQYKPRLIEATKRIEAELDASIIRFEASAVQSMLNHGLIVNQLSPEQEQAWYEEVGRSLPSLVGTIFDRGIYQKIEALQRTFRAGR